MAEPTHYYHRINCKSADAFRNVQLDEFNAEPSDRVAHILSLLTHRIPSATGRWGVGDGTIYIESMTFSMRCTDGEVREITTWWDEEGRDKSLIPNHRANAIIDAARFTTAERTHFSDNRNQVLKEHYGCNFVFGDLICELPVGTPPPDHTIYNNNPLLSIVQTREPSAEMISEHGRELAVNKLSPERMLLSIVRGSSVWQDTEYFVAPSTCNDPELKLLLRLWGTTEDALTRLIPNPTEPNGYATTLQFTREWATLNQQDKDRIWRLPQLPGTTTSACYDNLGRERPSNDVYRIVFGDLPRTEARQDFIRLMKSWEDGPAIQIYSLAQIEDSVTTYYQRDPALIYFHHERGRFMYMLGRPTADSDEGADEQNYQTELRNLRRALRDGRIRSVVEGPPLTLGGRELFTMEVEIRNRDCLPYFLLRRDGNMTHATKTPYFFLVHETGTNAINWINRGHQRAG